MTPPKFRPVGRDGVTPADQRIAELESGNASLRDRVAFLESELGARAGAERQMVRTIAPRIERPTDAELLQLFGIVSAKWPQTIASRNEAEAVKLFSGAFSYLSTSVSHADKRSRWAMSAWVDRAEEFLRRVGRSIDMKPGAIAAACAALGFSHGPLTGEPPSWDFWIAEGSHALPGPGHWRGLLKGGALRPPIETARRAEDPRGRGVTIEGGDERVGAGPKGILTW